jgi:hypothetical protein
VSNNLIGYIVVFILGFYLGAQVGCKYGGGTTTINDTVTDTAVLILPGEVSEIHVPTLVKETIYKTDTLIEFVPGSNKYEDDDTFYSIRRDYTDTVRFKEGQVVVNNSVYKNHLIAQQVFLDSVRQTVITNTVNIKDKPKGIVYFGAGANYSLDTTLGIKASLLWITKKGHGFELETGINTRSNVHVGFKYVIPIQRKTN